MARNFELKLSDPVGGQPLFSQPVPRNRSVLQPIDKHKHKIIIGRDDDFIEINPPEQNSYDNRRKNNLNNSYAAPYHGNANIDRGMSNNPRINHSD